MFLFSFFLSCNRQTWGPRPPDMIIVDCIMQWRHIFTFNTNIYKVNKDVAMLLSKGFLNDILVQKQGWGPPKKVSNLFLPKVSK